MSSEIDRAMDDAVRRGQQNKITIELARRHCLSMTFTEFGGRGMAEELYRLPINTRRVSCPVALGNASANLDWIASDFYNEHCVGCTQRRPTGEVPNLASVIEERAAQARAIEKAERERIERLREAWDERRQQRKAFAAEADQAMAEALGDIDLIDIEPGTEHDVQVVVTASRRLATLADRTSALFTDDMITHMVGLVENVGLVDLLAPLRHLAHRRPETTAAVLNAAAATLRRTPEVEAGRCVADLLDTDSRDIVDPEAVRSLVRLAAPRQDRLTGHAVTREPGGLRRVASLTPDRVTGVLREFLRPPGTSSLILPPGAGAPARESAGHSDDTATAAAAISTLISTHPEIVARLVQPLLNNLATAQHDPFEITASGNVRRTLATALLHDVGDVLDRVVAAGGIGDEEHRGRLFEVVELCGNLLDPEDRFRAPGDPFPDDRRRRELFDRLLRFCLDRAGADWGHGIAYRAANLASQLSESEPSWATPHLDAMLGALLHVVSLVDTPAPASLLHSPPQSPHMRALESFDRKSAIASAIREWLSALGNAARPDPMPLCVAINTVIDEERNRHDDTVTYYLLPLLGRLGSAHGAKAGVLREIVPTLHTFIVDTDHGLRAGALNAWTDIARRHDLPSSLEDLLPALLQDRYIVVIHAMLTAATRLTWSAAAHPQLFHHAFVACATLDAVKHTKALKSAMATAYGLADTPQARATIVSLNLARAAELERFDLRDVLLQRWTTEAEHTAQMAHLRLRQAVDPVINDRFNGREQQQLCALLACGPGLVDLPGQELVKAALALAPDFVWGSAEFAEVAWRAGRPHEAVTILDAILAATPDDPAHATMRGTLNLMAAAARCDTELVTGTTTARDAIAEANTQLSMADAALEQVCLQVDARLAIRRLLTETQPPHDTGVAQRQRADALAEQAEALTRLSPHNTATGAYTRAFADLCRIGSHLLRLDAAELDGDTDAITTQRTAAHRRATRLQHSLSETFPEQDPLAQPLFTAAREVESLRGSDVGAALGRWAAMLLPVPVVTGPQRSHPVPSTTSAAEDGPDDEQDVAVVLASVDDRLVTGPQVLRPSTAYELKLEIHAGQWPSWADQIDIEILSHFTQDEAQTPTFSIARPAVIDDLPLIATGTLILRFGLGAGRPAPPFLFALRWRGTRDGKLVTAPIDVTGHRELRLRPYDSTRDTVTQYPVFDEHLLALYDSLHTAGYNETHLQAFCRLFTAICRAGLRMTWSKKYKRGTSVREKIFHDDLFDALLADTELGQRLDRGTAVGLGYLDIRHDGITAELKVTKTAVTGESATKYMSQPTQYATADGTRLSILCILDLSKKTSPIGTPENYMFTLRPALHGLADPRSPSLVGVVVVNANLPTPSAWSRRRTPVYPETTGNQHP